MNRCPKTLTGKHQFEKGYRLKVSEGFTKPHSWWCPYPEHVSGTLEKIETGRMICTYCGIIDDRKTLFGKQ